MVKAKEPEKQETVAEEVRVKILPVNDRNLSREYVNVAFINHGENEFTIDFVDVVPPKEFEVKEIVERGAVEAPVKFRLVCTEVFVERFLSALEDNLRKFRAKAKNNE